MNKKNTREHEDIKFRAWDSKKKKMLKWTEILYPFDYQPNFNEVYDFHDIYQLMQYTGLKDINGVEIYEGDILESNYAYAFDTSLYDIFESQYAIVKYMRIQGDFSGGIGFNIVDKNGNPLDTGHCKVIGNIYQNPKNHLIK